MEKVSNWGQYPVIEGEIRAYRDSEWESAEPWIPRGMGRCYGDASLGPVMLSGLKHNRMLAFDSGKGILTCESGVTYDDLLRVFLPYGWFPPVTPGTKYVTLGGAIAADVHGKNHHVDGTIARHLLSFQLLTPKGDLITCSRESHPELFWATIGGMGLTGFITSLQVQLKPVTSSYIEVQSVKASNLDTILSLFEEFESSTYSVAWIDCLAGGKNMGRSILIKGEHTDRQTLGAKYQKDPLEVLHQQKLAVPFHLPSFTLNSLTVKIFNFFFYHKQVNTIRETASSYDGFFYPLDAIHKWNRIYGKKGFTQYQIVIPKHNGKEGLTTILQRISNSGLGSFLAVLKLMGKEEKQGLLSFPMEGYTLALDFPITRRLFPFLDELDQIVVEMGGRVYLAKDARLKAEMLEQMYPHLEEFKQMLHIAGNYGQVTSLQAKRLNIFN